MKSNYQCERREGKLLEVKTELISSRQLLEIATKQLLRELHLKKTTQTNTKNQKTETQIKTKPTPTLRKQKPHNSQVFISPGEWGQAPSLGWRAITVLQVLPRLLVEASVQLRGGGPCPRGGCRLPAPSMALFAFLLVGNTGGVLSFNPLQSTNIFFP